MSVLLLGNKKKKDIVKNGLILWLDGRDFKNSPPSTLWRDKNLNNKYTYINVTPNGDFTLDSNNDGLADGWLVYTSGAITDIHMNDSQQIYTPIGKWGVYVLNIKLRLVIKYILVVKQRPTSD